MLVAATQLLGICRNSLMDLKQDQGQGESDAREEIVEAEGGRRIHEIHFQDCGRVNGHEQGFQGGNYGKSRFIEVCSYLAMFSRCKYTAE